MLEKGTEGPTQLWNRKTTIKKSKFVFDVVKKQIVY